VRRRRPSVSGFWAAGKARRRRSAGVGAGVGSYCASHWSVARGSQAVRRVVIAISVVTLAEQLARIALLLLG
jgi:hypothetical protein